MPDIHVVPAASIESLRRKAKKLKKERGIPHHEALDMVARIGGVFPNWHHIVEAAKATEPSERAFKTGFLVGLDPKEASEMSVSSLDSFVCDERLLIFVLDELEKERREKGRPYEREEYEELVYLRYTRRTPVDFDKATDICAESFFFPPRYLRFKGEVIEALPYQEDEDV